MILKNLPAIATAAVLTAFAGAPAVAHAASLPTVVKAGYLIATRQAAGVLWSVRRVL